MKPGNTSDSPDGNSWEQAFPRIQEAVAMAESGDEIWVAAGVYEEFLALKPGVALYGGFAGNETERIERDWSSNETAIERGVSRLDRKPAPLVSIPFDADSNTRLDGFTLRNGAFDFGAAVYITGGSPIIANNTILYNHACGRPGGGAIVIDNPRPFSSRTPAEFFNAVADRLLRNHYQFGVHEIPVYPVNRYSGALHQLLQLSANLYASIDPEGTGEANPFPTIFQPQFKKEGGTIVIDGFVEMNHESFDAKAWRDLNHDQDREDLEPLDFVFGIPLVVTAKKGLPNFNELSVHSDVQVRRKLEFVRKLPREPDQFITNQLYQFSVSNLVAAEFWNPYKTSVDHSLEIVVTNCLRGAIFNEFGTVHQFETTNAVSLDLEAEDWTGGDWIGGVFQVPLHKVIPSLPLSPYVNDAFITDPAAEFEYENHFKIPRLTVVITNRFNSYTRDRDSGRILDFVNLDEFVMEIPVSDYLLINNTNQGSISLAARFWDSERIGGEESIQFPTRGIIEQIEASLGLIWTPYWENDPEFEDLTKGELIDRFRIFWGFGPLYNSSPPLPHDATRMQAPFTPQSRFQYTYSLQANDPLVHYTVEDLFKMDRSISKVLIPSLTLETQFKFDNSERLNSFYDPWGGNPLKSSSSDPFAYLEMVKDRGIHSANDWDFPFSPYLTWEWLNSIHRGTPWQSVYLGGEAVSLEKWDEWTGHQEPEISHPTNDFSLAEILQESSLIDNSGETTSAPIIVNNTFYGNEAVAEGEAIYVTTGARPVIQNNLFSEEGAVVFVGDGAQPVITSNCFLDPAAAIATPHGITPDYATDNIGDTPHFVSIGEDDFGLTFQSSCINAGNNAVIANGWVTRASGTAVQGDAIDIGAHELSVSNPPVLMPEELRVTEGELQVGMLGYPDREYLIEFSTDLEHWESAGTFLAVGGILRSSVAIPPGAEQLFVRASLVPSP